MLLGMNKTAAIARPSNSTKRATAADRTNSQRETLIQAGTQLLIRHGIASVSVEQVIAAAGVSRATFYGNFANKNELAAAILEPVFASGIEGLADIDRSDPEQALSELVQIYLQLWAKHSDALLLINGLNSEVFGLIQQRHDEFNAKLLRLLEHCQSAGLLRNGSAALTLEVLGRVAIPLLRVYKDETGSATIYRESLLALISN